ncbi:MAG: HAD family hydrolase [Candidatus Binatia bacterium]|nr:HAD family hydrolase [Candidatus Binatia bacterium]
MARIRAVLFDFGGTLIDYATLAQGERDNLLALAREAGIAAAPQVVLQTYRAALKRVFYEYLPRPYYLHRDLFRDVLLAMARDLGGRLTDALLEQYWERQRERRARDFALRDGVHETLTALRQRGLHLGIVSNADQEQLDHFVELGQLERYFDSLLCSEEAKSCKPDAGIFQEALRRAACAPEEALFVGDSLQQDIAGASRLGLRSVLIWDRTDREPLTDGPRPQHVIRRIPELLEIVSA